MEEENILSPSPKQKRNMQGYAIACGWPNESVLIRHMVSKSFFFFMEACDEDGLES